MYYLDTNAINFRLLVVREENCAYIFKTGFKSREVWLRYLAYSLEVS